MFEFPFAALPLELQNCILSFLDFNSLSRVSQVAHAENEMIKRLIFMTSINGPNILKMQRAILQVSARTQLSKHVKTAYLLKWCQSPNITLEDRILGLQLLAKKTHSLFAFTKQDAQSLIKDSKFLLLNAIASSLPDLVRRQMLNASTEYADARINVMSSFIPFMLVQDSDGLLKQIIGFLRRGYTFLSLLMHITFPLTTEQSNWLIEEVISVQNPGLTYSDDTYQTLLHLAYTADDQHKLIATEKIGVFWMRERFKVPSLSSATITQILPATLNDILMDDPSISFRAQWLLAGMIPVLNSQQLETILLFIQNSANQPNHYVTRYDWLKGFSAEQFAQVAPTLFNMLVGNDYFIQEIAFKILMVHSTLMPTTEREHFIHVILNKLPLGIKYSIFNDGGFSNIIPHLSSADMDTFIDILISKVNAYYLSVDDPLQKILVLLVQHMNPVQIQRMLQFALDDQRMDFAVLIGTKLSTAQINTMVDRIKDDQTTDTKAKFLLLYAPDLTVLPKLPEYVLVFKNCFLRNNEHEKKLFQKGLAACTPQQLHQIIRSLVQDYSARFTQGYFVLNLCLHVFTIEQILAAKDYAENNVEHDDHLEALYNLLPSHQRILSEGLIAELAEQAKNYTVFVFVEKNFHQFDVESFNLTLQTLTNHVLNHHASTLARLSARLLKTMIPSMSQTQLDCLIATLLESVTKHKVEVVDILSYLMVNGQLDKQHPTIKSCSDNIPELRLTIQLLDNIDLTHYYQKHHGMFSNTVAPNEMLPIKEQRYVPSF